MMLDGQTVRVMGYRFYGNGDKDWLIRPEPWLFWDGAWPDGWWLNERYVLESVGERAG